MSNRVTLDQLTEMPIAEVAALPMDQIAMLVDDADAAMATAKRQKEWLHTALLQRFEDRAAGVRRSQNKDTGTVHLHEDGYDVTFDLPALPKWDQKKLALAEAEIRSWDEDPADYMVIKRSISETAFKAWPPSIRKVFEPARTVETGRPVIKLKAIAKGRAA